MTPLRFYAGIGSRQTPDEVLIKMKRMASLLERLGFILRSGGANGADSAFESGVESDLNQEIYLPWKGFNGNRSDLYTQPIRIRRLVERVFPPAKTVAVERFQRRNAQQILGYHGYPESKVSFVLCWTPQGRGSGGTGMALRIARRYQVPVFDMGKEEVGHPELFIRKILAHIAL